jgi:hypothetical protein
MIESDYSDADSTWPDCQRVIESLIGDLRYDKIEPPAHCNASVFCRRPVRNDAARRSPVRARTAQSVPPAGARAQAK